MSNSVRLADFIEKQIAGCWGEPNRDRKNQLEVLCVRGTDLSSINLMNFDRVPRRFIPNKQSNRLLGQNSIIIEVSGGSSNQSTGRVGFISSQAGNIVCSNFCRGLVIREGYDARFFYYVLQNVYNSNIFFNYESKTTGIKNLLINTAFENILVPKFHLDTQKIISEVLSQIDEKIQINLKSNIALESLAKLIYDYWFLQFDFPDENGKPYKSSGGKMVYNKELKREIPEGWKTAFFDSYIAKDKSGDWGKESEQGNYTLNVNCIRGADINGIKGQGNIKCPDRFILQKNAHKLIESGDIVVEISGGSPTQSTARVAYINNGVLNRFDAPLISSNFCRVITLNQPNWVYSFFQEWQFLYDADFFFGWEGKTSGIKNFLFEQFLGNYKTVIPSEKLLNNYNSAVSDNYNKIQMNLLENQRFAELRDWLLPMLMNGQVTIKD